MVGWHSSTTERVTQPAPARRHVARMSYFGEVAQPVRTYEAEKAYLEQKSACQWGIKQGFVPGMRVPGTFYVNAALQKLVFDELAQYCHASSRQGFLPALKQIANVASLPGIVRHSIGLPDVHSGYGFAIGNVAAFDMADPEAVVSPGGVGFDINCGVRLLRTNLSEEDVAPVKEQLAQGARPPRLEWPASHPSKQERSERSPSGVRGWQDFLTTYQSA